MACWSPCGLLQMSRQQQKSLPGLRSGHVPWARIGDLGSPLEPAVSDAVASFCFCTCHLASLPLYRSHLQGGGVLDCDMWDQDWVEGC